MPIPDYQTIMLPLLKYCSNRKTETSTSESEKYLADKFKLSDKELKELLPSGVQPTFLNRIGWAVTYLKKAGLLEKTRRGFFKITTTGNELLEKKPSKVDISILKEYPEFIKFQNLKGTRRKFEKEEPFNTLKTTPSEALEEAYQNLRNELTYELLEKLKSVSPPFFEKIVVELLVKMGYGGSRADAGRAIGKSGDGGIDGIIKEDKLGLDVIYIQAKRWDSTIIGRPEIHKFVGALAGQGAKKGIFITTSTFSKEARDYQPKNETKIILIDGEELTQLMITNDVGVSIVSNYQVKRIDSDFFEDDI